ncbi:MAG TPA: D-alanyl-D-alanine carboxypeptidase/D-alanyl-D-alanine-endopeptidase [Actinomycetes bacterium]|jgi:D-alanyl-D-alanine carboxypeptidase/D-alanyl-D-alanine-endopeptidase (penicillin-binding protein 4)|nr:D-alanyl-D-alanine carboxypeptidase/D-alanyl-D-alanine-endopeptidase [Actinomycetes bacterium]
MPRRPHLARALAATAACAVAAAGLAVAAPTAAGAAGLPLSATDQAVHDRLAVRSELHALGPDLAGAVVDAATGAVVWGRTPHEAQIPASNAKILTAVDALEVFGPTHTFTTSVWAGATSHQVVLYGGGDPSLSTAQLGTMARAVAAALQAKGVHKVRVAVDDSLFPTPSNAYGWKGSYTIEDVSPVRALVVDQHRRWDTSLDAGLVFAKKLTRWGMQVRPAVHHTTKPPTSTVLASSQGATLQATIARMLQESDNDIAEGLHRLVALQIGFPATWTGAAQARTAELTALGVPLTTTMYDGSGLSRRDRISPIELTTVLGKIFDPAHPNLAVLREGAFAVAGVSGTLAPDYRRYVTAPTSCARGLIQAKTGSLTGVIALTGFTRGADGQIKLFSFLLNNVPSTLTTRRAVDRLAATVTGCW